MSDLHLWHRAELGKLKQDMEELFDSFVRDFCSPLDLRLLSSEPDVRVVNEKDAIIVSAHVPGLDPRSIKISVTGDRLAIAGEKVEEIRDGQALSISRHGFSSSVRLNAPVQANQVRATYSGGVLRIVLPRCTGCTSVQVSTEEHERGSNE
ncbi:Hsp20/alpha crystallin family protein [Desulfomicrobium sp. ZS1]|jgi:HSP20 family protein|uniref:Hsp20/alpha crystallin family protein n=1 Tax=Desulfomicrobium sp. ZS1 TaxID=2952228 RepID=UPI0020B3F911|nr:Hsp20/alpha crystallin family protein [Desulfomicrobium sp. ZS1]UTF50216.1 Hsp20/alpha crystallin family protein [Desulfomicrobium sp. ZS1]